MRILVWGGAGFIGCVLTEELLKQGYKVVVVDNFRKGIDAIKTLKPHENLKIEYGDVRDRCDVRSQSVRGVDYIVLLSGIVGLGDCNDNPKETVEVNVNGWRNVSENNFGIPIIGVSTGSVYGKIENGLCTEETEARPLSIYGKTKLEGEKPILEAGGLIYRYATAGGKSRNMRYNLLPNELTKLALDVGHLDVFEPDNMRTFIDIRDFANSIIFGINNYFNMQGKVYNVGDDRNNWSKRQVVEYIKEKTGCTVSYGDDRVDQDARNYACDYSKISNLGFKCQYGVDEMLDDLLEYYRGKQWTQ